MPALLPDERELARRRQSLVVLFELPHKFVSIAYAVGIVVAIIVPNPVAWIVGVLFAIMMVWRYFDWRAKWVLLTTNRIIRVQGLPETTQIEAFLRVDRVAGVVLEQSVLGQLLGYGTMRLEAPGDHPVLRRLEKIADVTPFYLQLRDVVFGTHRAPDPNDEPFDYVTEPLPPPAPSAPRDRFGRRNEW